MNLYLYELKSQRKSAILWACAMTALAALYLSLYPGISKDINDFKSLLSNYPEAVRAMLGINLDYIASLLGFYTMVFSFIMLCGTIQAANLGVSILSKESRENTADFLFVKPISRVTIIIAKLLAGLTTILATDAVFYLASLAIAAMVNTDSFSIKLFFMINLTMLFVQLIFYALGLLLSLCFRKIRSVLPISLGMVFGLYMVGALVSMDAEHPSLRVLSPFRYFDTSYIIDHSAFEGSYLLLSGILILLSVTFSYLIFIRKDIHAVS